MSDEYQSIHLQLTADRSSPAITEEELEELIEFCREELESTGEFVLHKFEDYPDE